MTAGPRLEIGAIGLTDVDAAVAPHIAPALSRALSLRPDLARSSHDRLAINLPHGADEAAIVAALIAALERGA